MVLNENLMYFQILKVTHASNPILNFVKINCLSDCLLTIIFITYECSIHCWKENVLTHRQFLTINNNTKKKKKPSVSMYV